MHRVAYATDGFLSTLIDMSTMMRRRENSSHYIEHQQCSSSIFDDGELDSSISCLRCRAANEGGIVAPFVGWRQLTGDEHVLAEARGVDR